MKVVFQLVAGIIALITFGGSWFLQRFPKVGAFIDWAWASVRPVVFAAILALGVFEGCMRLFEARPDIFMVTLEWLYWIGEWIVYVFWDLIWGCIKKIANTGLDLMVYGVNKTIEAPLIVK